MRIYKLNGTIPEAVEFSVIGIDGEDLVDIMKLESRKVDRTAIPARSDDGEITGLYLVSTVLTLLIIYNDTEEEPPYLFETLAFNPNGDIVLSNRYKTYEEAEKGHALACAMVRSGIAEMELKRAELAVRKDRIAGC